METEDMKGLWMLVKGWDHVLRVMRSQCRAKISHGSEVQLELQRLEESTEASQQEVVEVWTTAMGGLKRTARVWECVCVCMRVCESSIITIIFHPSSQREEIWSINAAIRPTDSTQKQSFERVPNWLVTAGKCNHQIASQVEIKQTHWLSACSGNASWSLKSCLITEDGKCMDRGS